MAVAELFVGPAEPVPSEEEALDAYSATVSRVAEKLLPVVASLRVGRSDASRPQGSGSAVAVSHDGLLVTSAHVVEGTARGVAAFADGGEYEMEVLGSDALSDLALVRARAARLETIEVGDADHLRVGQLVVAVGNPLGYAGSVTAGVVSGLGRSLPTRWGSSRRIVENVIQTDAALNPGNSGGALADSRARLVGINTAVAGVGLGLAVPINVATRQIVSALMRDGRVRRAWIGIAAGPRPLPPHARARLGRSAGVEIIEVSTGTPAQRAGLRAEDLIVEMGSPAQPIERVDDVQRLMSQDAIGRPMPIRVLRGDRWLDLEVSPVELVE
jgi:S1-C subfamily serine protease